MTTTNSNIQASTTPGTTEPAETANTRRPSPVAKEGEAPPAKEATKADKVLSLLSRKEGVSLDELIAATGWLRHTTRAALTGLKKKGHQVQRAKVDGVSRYAIAASK
jgi:hypothetical protein